MYLVIKVQTTWQVIMKSPWQRVNYPASDRVLLQIISQFCGWFQSLRKGFFGHFSLGYPCTLLQILSKMAKQFEFKYHGFSIYFSTSNACNLAGIICTCMSLLRNIKTQRNLLSSLMTPFLIDLEHCVDRSCTLLNLATNNSSQLTGQTIIQQVIRSVQISNLRFRPHSPVFLRFVLSKIVQ